MSLKHTAGAVLALMLSAAAARASADAIYKRGVALERSGRKSEALDRYRRAINRDAEHLAAHRAYQRLMIEGGKRDELIGKYDKLLARDPAKPLHKYLRHRLEPDAEKRREKLEVITSVDPNFFWAYYELAGLYALKGRLDLAVMRAERARDILVAKRKDDAEVRNTLGNLYVQAGKTKEAAAEFEKAVEVDPAFAEPYYNLALIKAGRGKTAEAEGYFKKAIELRPKFAEAYCSLGHLYGRGGKLGEAISQYKKAIEIKSDYGLAYNNLAVAHFKQGKKWLAMANLQRAKAHGFMVNPAFERAVIRSLGDEWQAPPEKKDSQERN